jgi:hypothetical protein
MNSSSKGKPYQGENIGAYRWEALLEMLIVGKDDIKGSCLLSHR